MTLQLISERDEARKRADSKHLLWMSELNRVTELEKQVEAMREAIKEAHDIFYDLAEHIDACDEEKLLACDNDSHPPSVFSVYGKYAKASLAKLQPFIKS